MEDITYYTAKTQKEPNNYIALTERGICYNLKGDFENALSDFNKAKEFDYKEAIDNLTKFDFD